MKRIALALGATALLAMSAGTAFADPAGAPHATVQAFCPGGITVDLIVIGVGGFTAAHDTASTSVFVPVWFSETTVSGGGTVDIYPEGIKGSAAPKGHDLITCSWASDVVEGGVTYTASGYVKGFFT